MNKSIRNLSMYIFPIFFTGLIVTLLVTHNDMTEVILDFAMLAWVLMVVYIGYKTIASDMMKSAKHQILIRIFMVFLVLMLVAVFVKWHFS